MQCQSNRRICRNTHLGAANCINIVSRVSGAEKKVGMMRNQDTVTCIKEKKLIQTKSSIPSKGKLCMEKKVKEKAEAACIQCLLD